MTPLEAARKLADIDVMQENCRCKFCWKYICDQWQGACLSPHAPSENHPRCPSQNFPRIVAALEAAEQLVQEDAHTNDYEVPYQGQMACNSCGAITRSHAWTDKEGRTFPEPHTADCSWQALVAALKGDV